MRNKQKVTKWAKIATKEEFLQIDNKIVDHKNATTNDSYAKSGTLYEYYSESMTPAADGFYYIPASQEFIDLGIFDGVELTDTN
jgi:hypothetical protein